MFLLNEQQPVSHPRIISSIPNTLLYNPANPFDCFLYLFFSVDFHFGYSLVVFSFFFSVEMELNISDWFFFLLSSTLNQMISIEAKE